MSYLITAEHQRVRLSTEVWMWFVKRFDATREKIAAYLAARRARREQENLTSDPQSRAEAKKSLMAAYRLTDEMLKNPATEAWFNNRLCDVVADPRP